jgi:hypothetical protein
MEFNEDNFPTIADLVDYNLHDEILKHVKAYLADEEGMDTLDILDKIDVCYDENNIPSTITMSTIGMMVEDINQFEKYLNNKIQTV